MELHQWETDCCPQCGRAHHGPFPRVLLGSGVLNRLGEELSKLQAKRVFLLADGNTDALAGARIRALLEEAKIPFSQYVFSDSRLEPNEAAVGSAMMHFDSRCDTVIALGSGVHNDLGKLLSARCNTHYLIVATAPSMDGYASSTGSMVRDGLKVSLPLRMAEVIVGDTDLLKNAPMPMLKAGLGDMLAKTVSLCEWQIAHLILGEEYCPAVADWVRDALKRCLEHAEELLSRREEAVEAVMEGLIVTGIAMSLVGASRPASGVEHYFSHLWDMRALEFGWEAELHGLQCAAGTYLAATLYHRILDWVPNPEKAMEKAAAFSYGEHEKELRLLLGKGAEAMIELEKREKKYDPEKLSARLSAIVTHWDAIRDLIRKEIPSPRELASRYASLGLPTASSDPVGAERLFSLTGDIRDKYVLSRLTWDLGWWEEARCVLREAEER